MYIIVHIYGEGVKVIAYALRTGGRGGRRVKNWQKFAYVLYGWPLKVFELWTS